MTKIFIATPAYGGTVNVPYAIALVETCILLEKNNIEYLFQINSTGTILVAERNRLISTFLNSDATHMLCIDKDIGWPASTVMDFINYDEEFVAGIYPTRQGNTYFFRAQYNEDGSLVKSKKNLIGMEYVSAGFMLLKRSAIEKMIEKFPELCFVSDNLLFESGYCLFNTEVWDGKFWGEDYVFSRRAREAGVNIWVDPVIEFDHGGVKGMLMQALMENNIIS